MTKRPAGWPLIWTMALLGGLVLVPAGAQEGDGSTEALEWAMIEAETALRHGEPQSAESHYRAALLEGWFLLGLLEVAADDLRQPAPRCCARPARRRSSPARPPPRSPSSNCGWRRSTRR